MTVSLPTPFWVAGLVGTELLLRILNRFALHVLKPELTSLHPRIGQLHRKHLRMADPVVMTNELSVEKRPGTRRQWYDYGRPRQLVPPFSDHKSVRITVFPAKSAGRRRIMDHRKIDDISRFALRFSTENNVGAIKVKSRHLGVKTNSRRPSDDQNRFIETCRPHRFRKGPAK